MNRWAIHHGGESIPGLNRRVYRREFESLLGYGTTWFAELRRKGVIPPGYTDPGGKRLWWHESEVRETLDKLSARAERATR